MCSFYQDPTSALLQELYQLKLINNVKVHEKVSHVPTLTWKQLILSIQSLTHHWRKLCAPKLLIGVAWISCFLVIDKSINKKLFQDDVHQLSKTTNDIEIKTSPFRRFSVLTVSAKVILPCVLYTWVVRKPFSPKFVFSCSIIPESIIVFFLMVLWRTRYWFSFRKLYCFFFYILATFCSVTL